MNAAASGVSKAELRQALQRLRATLPPDIIDGWSQAIAARLADLEIWTRSQAVHCYLGALPGEVRTTALVEGALRERRRVLCPRVRPHGQLEHRELLDTSHLLETAFGLLEPDPEHAPPAEPDEADLIIVPGVSFTAAGARLGMGGGYYDRFLARSSAPTIGLAFETQLRAALPQSPHDRPVDVIVTELRVIQCR
ncbi:MAG: 5-formyltetrahydrofolate cyclo-ligase [Chloroflexi bacterium]|nr:5-formyltetrahydrofolate cyclo-ligase [Chloroflexota bacterium]